MGIHGNGPDTLCAVLEKELPGASPVHRLDAPTEGLVLCGRDREAVWLGLGLATSSPNQP